MLRYLLLFLFYLGLLCHFCAGYPEVFVVEEWVKDARNEARAKDNLHIKADKSLGAMK